MSIKLELKKYRETVYVSDEAYKNILSYSEPCYELVETIDPQFVISRALDDIYNTVNLTDEQINFFRHNIEAQYEKYRDCAERCDVHQTRVYLNVPEHFIEDIYKMLSKFVE